MPLGLVIDILVVLVVASAIVTGAVRGLVGALGALTGIVAGGAAALVVMPRVSTAVPYTGWNVIAAFIAGLALIFLGVAIGEALAKVIRRPLHRVGLGIIDRILGGIAGAAVSIGVLMMLVMSVGSFGMPGVAHAVASSRVLAMIEDAMPAPVESALARIRSIAIEDGIPILLDSAGAAPAEVPEADSNTEALRAASASVTRIAANAPLCRATSSGSGFVMSEELVMTNAHVVAGARDIVVEAPGELPRTASVIYFNADTDIAVLRVEGLGADPVSFTSTPENGTVVFFQGYPYGGPLVSRSAEVLSTAHTVMRSTHGVSLTPRSVTRIAGHVEPGNSGGPLLTGEGAVAGMIFAQADGVANQGFALSMEELMPVLAVAPELSQPVSTGSCP